MIFSINKTNRYSEKSLLIIGLTAFIAIFSIAVTGFRFYELFYIPAPANTDTNNYTSEQPSNSRDIYLNLGTSLSKLNVFGDTSNPPMKAQKKIEVTRLQLTLKGILAGNPERNALALIGKGQARESAFAIDDNLPGGAILRKIHTDHIIIEHAGKLERLPLKRPEITLQD